MTIFFGPYGVLSLQESDVCYVYFFHKVCMFILYDVCVHELYYVVLIYK